MEGPVSMREAVPEDYGQVSAINLGIYDGFDYLQPIFHWMLHTKENHPYVAVIGGKVVAFANQYLLPGGHMSLATSSRVANGYQGRGIVENLKQFSRHALHDKFPNLRTVVWTSSQTEAEDRYLAKNNDKMRCIGTWNIMRRKCIPKSLKLIVNDFSLPSTKSQRISLSLALSLLPRIKGLITKHNDMIIAAPLQYWGAWSMTDDAIRHIIRTSDIIASFETTNGEKRLIAVGMTSVAMSTINRNLSANLVFYGENTDDFIDQLRVFMHHVEQVSPHDCGQVGFYLHFPKYISVDAVNRVLPQQLELISENAHLNIGRMILMDI